MVVDDRDVVRRRSVQAGTARGSMTVIVEGLDEGERVVVSGLQKIRDGDTVASRSEEKQAVATPSKKGQGPSVPESGVSQPK